jgi:hypothetical protein
MIKQPTLRPSDLVIACQLAMTPEAKFTDIAESTGISAGECHNAVRRLRLAHILLATERRPVVDVLHHFLVHGAPFAFPAVLGSSTLGVLTAHSAQTFHPSLETTDRIVWPCADGKVRGQSLIPLFPAAPALAATNPLLYDLLTIIDALRVGTTRVRKVAAELLAERLCGSGV